MKECKYCRTTYEDSLPACPSCGGTKIITAQEKAEDAALYQKELENRKNAVAVVATKRKLVISVLVGVVVIIIAAIDDEMITGLRVNHAKGEFRWSISPFYYSLGMRTCRVHPVDVLRMANIL